MRRNNYKQILTQKNMEKRGQTTAFIIVAIVIVVFGILIYFLFPKVGSFIGIEAEPNSFIRECVEPEVQAGVNLLAAQGGYANPEGYILYNGNKVKYLCYSAQYYVPCYVQQPLIKSHFEQELAGLLETKVKDCAGQLKKYYEARGYDVSGGDNAEVSVTLSLHDLDVVIKAPMTITKDTTQKFETFEFNNPSEMYSLLMISTNIIDFESTYGDSETTLYMRYYPNIQILKTKLIDGSTVYTVGNVESEEKFTFASRSLAWPPGYGITA